MPYWVYILASKPNGTLYVGVTRDLLRRAHEHKTSSTDGFTSRYDVKRLMYFEEHDKVLAAIQREKNIKHWPRAWKIDLIRTANPDWRDLYPDISS